MRLARGLYTHHKPGYRLKVREGMQLGRELRQNYFLLPWNHHTPYSKAQGFFGFFLQYDSWTNKTIACGLLTDCLVRGPTKSILLCSLLFYSRGWLYMENIRKQINTDRNSLHWSKIHVQLPSSNLTFAQQKYHYWNIVINYILSQTICITYERLSPLKCMLSTWNYRFNPSLEALTIKSKIFTI